MWWLDPGKEVLNILFNRILAPYVENLDMNQVSYGIGQGKISLGKLRLKKGALDKFRLPVDVLEGHLGKFTLSMHWMNLGNQPVEIYVEDIFLLVVPSPQSDVDPQEEDNRAQAAKAERLQNAELLHMKGGAEIQEGSSPQQQGLVQSLIAKIINNVQVTVKNIHIRYEDNLSVPGHPFAAGVTLAGFTASSVNENWEAAFIESSAGAIRKLAKLRSLALYFDTDTPSMAGLPLSESLDKFRGMISDESTADHQFILKPVSGEGRVVVNHGTDSKTPRFDVQLLFDEIGIALDSNQYRDVISLVDMYHVNVRQRQYRKFRPDQAQLTRSPARARLQFAGKAILDSVHEKNRKWTWGYFAQRRDDRRKYVELFKKKSLNPSMTGPDVDALTALEKGLSYEDIRFYRSIARSDMKKDQALRKRLDDQKKAHDQKQTWGSWLWGSSSSQQSDGDAAFGGDMTEQQRKELYQVLDFDEKTELISSFQAPKDSLKMCVVARLKTGSFALRERDQDVLSIKFDALQSKVIQRPENLEASVSLGGFSVYDGTTEGTLYPQIVRVKESQAPIKILPIDEKQGSQEIDVDESSFFYFKFEKNPLDERADTALTLTMRHMEIIYHKGYVEAVYKFFKPPASQLESVEALLDVASQTLEGLRKETRAGLEYALQTHKTVDIRMDMNAPIIIIPEDITTHDCKHLVVDAGHISIDSDHADKEAIKTIQQKRHQKYNDEDYHRLESLMYDKVSLKLEDAQFLIGNDLQSCLDALTSNAADSLHIVEKVSLGLQVHNSIVPSALNLARFKVSGKLPTLEVNLSDTKYKALMRLIDVCIPHFNDDDDSTLDVPKAPAKTATRGVSSGFHLPSLFESRREYNVDEHHNDEDDEEDPDNSKDDVFFEAEDSLSTDIQQQIFVLDFAVDNLKAYITKTGLDGKERPLGKVSLDLFNLDFGLAKHDMKVDITLRSLTMHLLQEGHEPLKFMSSVESEETVNKDLLKVQYRRAQKTHPEFMTVYEGINQSVDVQISTFVFRATPEPVIALYDFVMTTFVPKKNDLTIQAAPQPVPERPTLEVLPPEPQQNVTDDGKIRVKIKLDSVQVKLLGEETDLATLSLSTADVMVLLVSGTINVGVRLGSLALSNDSSVHQVLPEFNQIMSIEGDNFAEFRYQTFDTKAADYNGINSSVYLRAASVKLHFLESPLHDIYLFLMQLATLKGLYDAAAQAAVQSASEIELVRMQYEISVKSPIVILPSDPAQSKDHLVMRLGEISAKNQPDLTVNHILASLNGIQLKSKLFLDSGPSELKIIDDIDVKADVKQLSGVDRSTTTEDFPETQINVVVSDVRLQLTQMQYCLLMTVMQAVPRVFSAPPSDTPVEPPTSTIQSRPNLASTPSRDSRVATSLQPELRPRTGAASKIWTKLDVLVTVGAVKLHLYDASATHQDNLKQHGIARFALNHNSLRLKMLSDGAMEAQIVLKSFLMSNTRPGTSKFREIIPTASHDRNQFMLLYTQSGNGPSLAVLTVDSPKVIFTIDPVFALLEFFMSAFKKEGPSMEAATTVRTENTRVTQSTRKPDTTEEEADARALDFRVDLHDVSLSVLENDADPESQALTLSISQFLMSQQRVLAVNMQRLGMSLVKMNKPSESVRILDEVDMTFSLDNRSTDAQSMQSIEMTSKPIVFRASYQDINVVMSIVNKAIEMYSQTQQPTEPSQNQMNTVSVPSTHQTAMATKSVSTTGKASVVVSKEQLRGTFDGFRLILIGDMYEQPMFHLNVKPFDVNAKDWTGELSATTTIATQISFWNLTNSHWEPFIDPWTFSVSVARESPSAGINLTLSAQERLDVNLSTTFIELVLAMMKAWGQVSVQSLEASRGSYAPYRIKNLTGTAIHIWADSDSAAGENSAVRISDGQTVDWRFEDWKTMREHMSSSAQQNIGVQFVGKSWENLRSLPIDREGEFTFSLKPRIDKLPARILCEVKLENNTKVVTIRSTYIVENKTLYPLELTLVDTNGHPVYSLQKITPGSNFALPLDAVMQNRIRLQPDQGFGYKWCSALRWEDIVSRKAFTIKCPHSDPKEASFRFQVWVETDAKPNLTRFPQISLQLRAPIELENLLPHNIEYRIFDKDTNQNWRSFLRKGGIMPVHSVELAHLILLNILVQDTVFKQSEFSIVNTNENSEFDIENHLSLRDAKERTLDLRLNYVRYQNSGGAFKLQIYTPYLLVNKTGLPLFVRSVRRAGSAHDVAGETNADVLSTPAPLMLSHPSEQGHEFSFKLGDSAWSKTVSFKPPSADMELCIGSSTRRDEEVHAGLSWSEGTGKYKLTKVITLTPRFLIKNSLSQDICFREHGVAPKDRLVISPGQRLPFSVMREADERVLTFAFTGLNAQWSPAVSIGDIGTDYFRLQTPNVPDAIRLVKCTVEVQGPTIFVTLTSADREWPFKIVNDSQYPVALSQKVEEGVKAGPQYNIPARATLEYAWDFPAALIKRLDLTINGSHRNIDPKEIGNLVPFKFKHNNRNKAVSIDVSADGAKQILRITNYHAETSVYKPRRADMGTLQRSDTISSSVEVFEAVTEDIPPSLTFNIDFSGIGVSMVNRNVVEVLYVSLKQIKFTYSNSPIAHSLTLTCGHVQVDNQLHDAIFPVILQPTPIAKEANGITALPTVQASLILLKDEAHGVTFVKYCSILLQALTIEADEDLLFSLIDLSKIQGASWEEDTQEILIKDADHIPEPDKTSSSQQLYFEVLELQPIKLLLSFMRTERVSSDEKLNIRNPLAVLFNAALMAIGNVNDAPLELNSLAIRDVRLTPPDLQNRIIYHYRQDVLRQIYRILCSADLFGNPVGLFTNVSSGVADIFYEPFNGVVEHGNKELGIGIAKGAASFVKKTVFGVSDSFTKITSSVGKGISAATFDSEYQARRRMTQRRNRPRHAIYGVTSGGEAFATSVASAMEGVLMKPIEGAESGGAFGFFKGVGKGLAGAVTKPVVGVFDLASNVSEGIRNTTTVFDKPDRDRTRFPRHTPPDGVLKPYSERESLGQYWMKDLDNGAYRGEAYVAHINTPGGDNVVLLTTTRLLSFWHKRLRLEWELPFSNVQGVTVEDNGIRFSHKSGREHDKFVFIPDKSSQSWFFGQVAGVVKTLNTKRRMDS